MRKIYFFSLMIATSLGTSAQQSKISGSIKDLANNCEQVVINSTLLHTNQDAVTDTIPCKKGRFNYELSNKELRRITFYPIYKPNKDGSIPAMPMSGGRVLVFPGDKLKIDGELANYKIHGSKFYDELNAVETTYADQIQKRDSIIKVYPKINKEDAQAVAQFREGLFATMKNIEEKQMDYVKKNPTSLVSAYLFTQFNLNDADEDVFNLLQGEAKNGAFRELLELRKKQYEANAVKREAEKKTAEKMPAPSFTLKSIDGKDVSLSDFKGKYVVLDFWGSWCGWCIKGFPDMKKYYSKYQSKVEFLGVDCGDTEEKWKKAVDEHQIPWVNVKNGENDNDVTKLYGVGGYPTKIIIDPQGVIYKRVVGESPEFYQALDEALKD